MESSKKEKIYKVIMLILVTATVTFMITSIGMYNYFVRLSDDTETIAKKLEIVKNELEKYYIGDMDTESMTETAIKGYVAGLKDDYSEYLTKEEYEELLISITGDYVGIGIYMSKDVEGNIIVVSPIVGSPAEEAGLQAGDIITAINGESCSEMDLDTASSKIKGQEGTTVELEILRENEKLNKTVERRTVEIQDSRSEILEGNIGYIQLTTFDEGCADNVEQYLLDFQNQGINSVIIDLRDNTGGVVTEAIDFAELFVKRGDIIMRSYNKADNVTLTKSNNTKPVDMEIVILVNEYSASATEIVTAALKDNEVATIVGTTTYGKGVMQEVMPLFDGALKVTTEEFKTPNGNEINRIGIMPDEIVEDNVDTEEDEQLQKAIEILK